MAIDARGNEVGPGDVLSCWSLRDEPVPHPEGEVLAITRDEVIVGHGRGRATRIKIAEFGQFDWVKWLGKKDEQALAAYYAELEAESKRLNDEHMASIPAEHLAQKPEVPE